MNGYLDELDLLLLNWESGERDEVGIARIREILREHDDARVHFVREQLLTAALYLDADAGQDPMTLASAGALPASGRAARSRTRSGRWLIAAASLIVCGLAGRVAHLQWTSDRGVREAGVAGDARPAEQEATSSGVALVTRLVGVRWEPGQAAVEVGEALRPGRFAFASGHVQLEFYCGATVVIEGPADLQLDSATLARVRRGRLRAHVPPAARGFALQLEEIKLVDLGTEFGVLVSPEATSIQVFNGEVELRRPSRAPQLLTTGQAVSRTSPDTYEASLLSPGQFVDIADLELLVQRQQRERFERWQAWSSEALQDPRLIAYYGFDQPGDWERRLVCGKRLGSGELDGAIVGAREVPGRWDAKRALEFKQPGDRVRVQIPGEFRSLTLACWVKIDSLDRWYNSLFLTDGYDKGEPHWQILDDGRLYFSVRPAERGQQGPRDFKALSPPFWRPTLAGKWLHLAVSWDQEAAVIVHYVDGEVWSRHAVPRQQVPTSTRIGAASIGNWALPTIPEARFAIRNLNGCLDEFAIYGAALREDEIKEMYQHGTP